MLMFNVSSECGTGKRGSSVPRPASLGEYAVSSKEGAAMSPVLLAILAAGPLGAQGTVAPGANALHGIAVSINTGMMPMADNPFLHPSTLPYELPPFDKIKDADYLPAFEAGMREHRREVDAIVHNREPASFENTIVALER